MADDDLEYLRELTFYHGTTMRLWSDAKGGNGTGLYVTIDARDALIYAEEAAIGEAVRNEDGDDGAVEAIVVIMPGHALAELLAAKSAELRLEPDWGWVDAVGHANGGVAVVQPHWCRSLEACGGIHVGGFSHADKEDLVVVGYDDFESALDQAGCARP